MTKRFATVHTMDPSGSVTVRVDTDRYVGSINDAPSMVAAGDRLLLLLSREDEPNPTGHVELFAKITSVDNDAGGRSSLFAGLRLEAEIESWSDEVEVERTHIDSRIFRLPIPVVAQLDGYQSDSNPPPGEQDTVMTPYQVPSDDSAEVAPLPTEDEALIEPSGVIGTLREVSLPEVVQSLELSRKTARIDIDQGSHRPRGKLFLKNGQIVHAVFGETVGEEAFFMLSEVSFGTYRIRFHRETDQRTVEKPTGFLLLEALRIVDERHRSAAPSPVLDAIAPSAEPAPFLINLDDDNLDDEDRSHTNLHHPVADVSRMTAEGVPFPSSIPDGFSLEDEMMEGLGDYDAGATDEGQLHEVSDPADRPPLLAAVEEVTVPGRLVSEEPAGVHLMEDDVHTKATVEASGLVPPAAIRPAMQIAGPLSSGQPVPGPHPQARAPETSDGFEGVSTSVFSAFFEEASASGENSDEAVLLDDSAILSMQSDSFDSVPPL